MKWSLQNYALIFFFNLKLLRNRKIAFLPCELFRKTTVACSFQLNSVMVCEQTLYCAYSLKLVKMHIVAHIMVYLGMCFMWVPKECVFCYWMEVWFLSWHVWKFTLFIWNVFAIVLVPTLARHHGIKQRLQRKRGPEGPNEVAGWWALFLEGQLAFGGLWVRWSLSELLHVAVVTAWRGHTVWLF